MASQIDDCASGKIERRPRVAHATQLFVDARSHKNCCTTVDTRDRLPLIRVSTLGNRGVAQ